jgi:hypothetical protein
MMAIGPDKRTITSSSSTGERRGGALLNIWPDAAAFEVFGRLLMIPCSTRLIRAGHEPDARCPDPQRTPRSISTLLMETVG